MKIVSVASVLLMSVAFSAHAGIPKPVNTLDAADGTTQINGHAVEYHVKDFGWTSYMSGNNVEGFRAESEKQFAIVLSSKTASQEDLERLAKLTCQLFGESEFLPLQTKRLLDQLDEKETLKQLELNTKVTGLSKEELVGQNTDGVNRNYFRCLVTISTRN